MELLKGLKTGLKVATLGVAGLAFGACASTSSTARTRPAVVHVAGDDVTVSQSSRPDLTGYSYTLNEVEGVCGEGNSSCSRLDAEKKAQKSLETLANVRLLSCEDRAGNTIVPYRIATLDGDYQPGASYDPFIINGKRNGINRDTRNVRAEFTLPGILGVGSSVDFRELLLDSGALANYAQVFNVLNMQRKSNGYAPISNEEIVRVVLENSDRIGGGVLEPNLIVPLWVDGEPGDIINASSDADAGDRLYAIGYLCPAQGVCRDTRGTVIRNLTKGSSKQFSMSGKRYVMRGISLEGTAKKNFIRFADVETGKVSESSADLWLPRSIYTGIETPEGSDHDVSLGLSVGYERMSLSPQNNLLVMPEVAVELSKGVYLFASPFYAYGRDGSTRDESIAANPDDPFQRTGKRTIDTVLNSHALGGILGAKLDVNSVLSLVAGLGGAYHWYDSDVTRSIKMYDSSGNVIDSNKAPEKDASNDGRFMGAASLGADVRLSERVGLMLRLLGESDLKDKYGIGGTAGIIFYLP